MGNYGTYTGKSHEAVVAQFKAAGVENIQTYDLDDAGLFHKDGEIESISIGGNSTFQSSDYFSPDDIVIISYY